MFELTRKERADRLGERVAAGIKYMCLHSPVLMESDHRKLIEGHIRKQAELIEALEDVERIVQLRTRLEGAAYATMHPILAQWRQAADAEAHKVAARLAKLDAMLEERGVANMYFVM